MAKKHPSTLHQDACMSEAAFAGADHYSSFWIIPLLVWIGSMYAPLLPFFGVAANVAQFYVKKLLALYLYTPPKERYSASQDECHCVLLDAW